MVYQKFSNSDSVNVISPINTTLSTPSSSQPSTNSMMNSNSMMAKTYRDGEYTGDVADAYYGNIQVKLVISGGKILDVQFLQYPNDRGNSIEINTQAMPYLKQEAIQAQSDQVEIVSGATQTSLAFRESLKSALARAI